MKKNKDFESDKETFQNFIHTDNSTFQSDITTTVEKQNQIILKKIEEKKRL